MTLELELNELKSDVLLEVERTCAYTGAKIADTTGQSYERVSMVSEDSEALGRFWEEAIANVCGALSRFVSSHTASAIILEPSSAFNASLAESIRMDFYQYIVQYICGKWFMYTNKDEAAVYLSQAQEKLSVMRAKLFRKLPPQRK